MKKDRVSRYVEALNLKEVETIIALDRTGQPFDIINLDIIRQFPDRFLWEDDSKAMKGIKEAFCGPYGYLVLFFFIEP
jgi:hypothetical protein